MPEEAKDERDFWGLEGVQKMEKGSRRDFREGKERIGVVKAASFLDIIYLSAVGPEESEGGRNQAIQRERQEEKEGKSRNMEPDRCRR